MKQTKLTRATFGIAYWKGKAKQLERENFALKKERDLWKQEALKLSKDRD